MKMAYIAFLASLLLSGTNGIVASFISLPSSQVVFLRAMIGSLFMIAIFLIAGKRFTFWQHKRHFLYLALSGATMGASLLFVFEAYREVGVGVSALVYYCAPVIVMALSPLLFGEKLTRPKVIGFGVVLVGLFLLNGQTLSQGGSQTGLLLAGMGALTFAAFVILNKKATEIKGLENTVLQLFFSFLTIGIYIAVTQGFAFQIAQTDWLPILILGFVNTGIGGFLYFSAMGKLPVQTVSICGYMEPLSAVILSAFILQETLAPLQVAGTVLIVGGAVAGMCIKQRSSARREELPTPGAAQAEISSIG